ncbi:5'-AMP-activated protein kinase beta subunit [Klebsormidium nitens]|uniref:5'-AMP-activated protein kinase beta subunit n=1 Tax=Klebsormidium nitens TaxID=105231 RepID=A0A1Y1IL81_KLENI|nr:5'-AMP-activated protein kinase beta subunit [Klebsormidium nitens]|eukprot:GAQ89891.1 5'-AMP-activated protein kinase beta subunit [Klebsormidium nitens]
MGNTSGKEGRARGDGRPVADGGRVIGGSRFGHSPSSESMQNSPPDSPGSAARSPLMFTPQIPMVPIPRGDEYSLGQYGSGGYGQQGMDEQQPHEQGVPTMIVWSHPGTSVSVEGSWDNWTTRQPLQKSGKDFTLIKMLPPGIYQYKFIVDDEWRYATDLPAMYDDQQNVNNVLEVQEYVPENLDNIAGFEPPRSPPTSYSNAFPGPEDYAKEPPGVPPHLQLTLLNVPPSIDTPTSLPRPQHVILNHVYCEKTKTSKSVLALGVTHRFRSKYVTVVLYKPLKR